MNEKGFSIYAASKAALDLDRVKPFAGNLNLLESM